MASDVTNGRRANEEDLAALRAIAPAAAAGALLSVEPTRAPAASATAQAAESAGLTQDLQDPHESQEQVQGSEAASARSLAPRRGSGCAARDSAPPLDELTRQLAKAVNDVSGRPYTERETRSFQLVRLWASIAPDLPAMDAVERLDAADSRWWKRLGTSHDSVVSAIAYGATQLRYPEGEDPLTMALARARSAPLRALGPLRAGDSMHRLVSLLKALGDTVQPNRGSVALPARKVASTIGSNRSTVSDLLGVCRSAGVLRKVPPKWTGGRPKDAKRLANEYEIDVVLLDRYTEPFGT